MLRALSPHAPTTRVPWAERLVAPLDAARGAALRTFGPWGRAVLVSRAHRVAWVGSAMVLVAFVLALRAPSALFVAAPLVLGVPHVVADVRYLVLRPGIPARRGVAIVAALGVALALAAGIAGALVGASALVVASRASVARRVAFASLALATAAFAFAFRTTADAAFAHAHNLVAVAFFVALSRRDGASSRVDRALTLAPVALAIALAGVIFATPATSLEVFVFGQSVHYLVWLRLVPEVARPSETARSFRQSLRALTRDVGLVVMTVAAMATAAFFVWGIADASTARAAYVRIASFHGYGEVVLGALFLAEGRPLTPPKAPPS